MKIIDISHNLISDILQLRDLGYLQELEDLHFDHNPIPCIENRTALIQKLLFFHPFISFEEKQKQFMNVFQVKFLKESSALVTDQSNLPVGVKNEMASKIVIPKLKLPLPPQSVKLQTARATPPPSTLPREKTISRLRRSLFQVMRSFNPVSL